MCKRTPVAGFDRRRLERRSNSPDSVRRRNGLKAAQSRWQDAEWCPVCLRPFAYKKGRPWAVIGPPPGAELGTTPD